MDWSDRLGQLLVTRVRDRALQDMIKMTDGSAKAPELVAKLAHLKARHGEDGVAGARFVLEEAVDHVLHHMLVLFEDEQDALKLAVEMDGKWIDAAAGSDGLAGELYSPDGWIQRFSRFSSSEPSDSGAKE